MTFEGDQDIEQYLFWNQAFLKLGFVSSLFSAVEGVLKSYLQFLEVEAYSKVNGIKNVCKCLIEEKLEWDAVKFDYNVFDLLRLIRNTLHSNGIHFARNKSEKNIPISYKGKTYSFIEGERINFVTWDLLLDIADDIRVLLFHLANNKKIREIKGLMPDRFAI